MPLSDARWNDVSWGVKLASREGQVFPNHVPVETGACALIGCSKSSLLMWNQQVRVASGRA
jgi:hypothetical protein